MINKTRCLFYEVDGKYFKDLKEAQKADLASLLPEDFFPSLGDNPTEGLTTWMLENAAALVDTLTTSPKSRLRARKSHGAVRKKKTEKPTCAAPGQT